MGNHITDIEVGAFRHLAALEEMYVLANELHATSTCVHACNPGRPSVRACMLLFQHSPHTHAITALSGF